MLDEIQRDYRVDPDRVYAMGWSMGGAGSFLMALRFSDRFAAVMPVAGSIDTTLIPNARHVPTWNFHESGDVDVSPGYSNVQVSGLEPQKLYRVAVTEPVLGQSVENYDGFGYLGWLPKIAWTGMTEADAQEQYLSKHCPVKSILAGRIAEV